MLVTVGQDKQMCCYSVETGQLMWTTEDHADNISDVLFTETGSIITGSWDRSCNVTSSQGTLVRTIAGHGHFINNVAVSPNGKWFASGSVDMSTRIYPMTAVMQVMSQVTPKSYMEHFGWTSNGCSVHSNMIRGLHFHPLHRFLATGSWDRTIKLFQVSANATFTLVATIDIHSKRVNWVEFSPSGKLLVTASMDGSCCVLDSSNGGLLTTLRGHSGNVLGATFTHDDRYVASGASDNVVNVWFWRTQTLVATLRHQSWVSVVKFLSYGRLLLCATMEGSLHVWNTKNGIEVLVIRNHDSAILSMLVSQGIFTL
jgi:WD40 repeat protein